MPNLSVAVVLFAWMMACVHYGSPLQHWKLQLICNKHIDLSFCLSAVYSTDMSNQQTMKNHEATLTKGWALYHSLKWLFAHTSLWKKCVKFVRMKFVVRSVVSLNLSGRSWAEQPQVPKRGAVRPRRRCTRILYTGVDLAVSCHRAVLFAAFPLNTMKPLC